MSSSVIDLSGLVQKFKDIWSIPEDDDQDIDSSNDNEFIGNNISNVRENSDISSTTKLGTNKVVNINATAKLQVILFKPEKFGENIREIADELLKMHTIVLNLEETSKESARRIMDFLSGAAYANGGEIRKVSVDTYLITPYNVNLVGDVVDELENNGFCL